MIIAVLDPDKKQLSKTVKAIKSVFACKDVIMFSDPMIASHYIEENVVDILFTQVPMLYIDGVQIHKKLTHLQPGSKIIYMADNGDYAVEAMREHAYGYLVKPITAEKVKESIKGIQKGM